MPSKRNTLVLQAQGGDVRALETLLTQTQPDLRRFAGRVCATGEDAEDAIQHALFIVSSRIGTLRAVGRFTAWVFTVIRNECARNFRMAGRWVGLESSHEPRALTIGPDEAIDRTRLAQQLTEAIADLPAEQREVFIRRELEGMSAAETAAALELSIANVKVRLHRARRALRERLSPHVE